jgi:Tol biopolymer transport system component
MVRRVVAGHVDAWGASGSCRAVPSGPAVVTEGGAVTMRARRVGVFPVVLAVLATTSVAVAGSPPAEAAPTFSYRAVASHDDAGTSSPSISADGDQLAFETAADLSGDGRDLNDTTDVYLLDRNGAFQLLSAPFDGETGPWESWGPIISADGDHVAFTTRGGFDQSDDNGVDDVYRWQRFGTAPILVSYPGTDDIPAVLEDLSADGSTVVWSTERELPGISDDNGLTDVFATSVESGDYRILSVDADGNAAGPGASYSATSSADGSLFAYLTTEHASMGGDLNPLPDVVATYGVEGNSGFQLTGTTDLGVEYRVGGPPLARGTEDAVEAEGERPAGVVLRTEETLTGVDTGGTIQAYLWEQPYGGSPSTVELLTSGVDGEALDQDVIGLALSPDERYLLFATPASNVLPGNVNPDGDVGIYLLDLDEPQDDRVPVLVNELDGLVVPGAVGGSSEMAVSDTGQVAFTAYDGPLDPTDTNGHPDVLITDDPEPLGDAQITSFSVGTSAGDADVPVGLDTVDLTDIPVGSLPLGNVNLAATPIRSIDVAASPIRSIPIRSIPIRSITMLDGLDLASLPIEGGWAPRLEDTPYAGVPLHTVTLGQLAALPDATTSKDPLEGLELRHLDVAATPIRSISLASIALGATPIRSIPIRSIDGTTCTYGEDLPQGDAAVQANWQAVVDCLLAGFQVGSDTTLAALDVAGVPIRSIPIRSIPIRSIDLQHAPIRSIPIRSIELAATPIRSIPIRSILMSTPIRSIPIRSIPIRSIDVKASPIRSIPIRSIPVLGAVVDCSKVDCTEGSQATLGDVADADAIVAGATLEDLDAALEGFVLGDLFEYGDTTIGHLLDAQFTGDDPLANVTLGDVLVALLLRGDYPWEELPVADMGLQPIAPTPELVSGSAQAVVSGAPSATEATFAFELPPGAVYAAGSGSYQRLGGGLGVAELLEPDVQGRELTFTLPGNGAGATTTVEFQYHPGVRLVSAELEGRVDIGTDRAEASSFAYEHTQRDRPGDPDEALVVPSANTLVVGHLAQPGEVDHYRIPAADVAGKRVRIDLGVAGVDQDLVLYAPAGSTPPTGTTLESVPIRSIAVEDGVTEVVPPETLQDIPIRSIPIRSISANRGEEHEAIEVLADETTEGYYTIQVSGFNGSSSPDPYVLRVRVWDPPNPMECTPRPIAAPTAPTGDAVTPAPLDTEALFVVNPSRLDAVYGGDAGADVLGALEALLEDDGTGSNALGMPGHVLEVDGSAAVREAYDAWDADPCSPAAANAVVAAITGVVEASHLSAAGSTVPDVDDTIPYVVLVGGDDTLPQARVPDLTRIANERSYLPDLAGDHPLAGAAAAETLLSDDPYGDRDPVPWLNRHLYVPDTALGRLVETPDQIVAQLERYATWDGSLEPTTAAGDPVAMTGLVTGYDFLSDGAEAVADALDDNDISTAGRRMIDGTWSRKDLSDALFGDGTAAPGTYAAADVLGVNAHFDHHRSLPADQDAAHVEDDLFTVGDVDDAPDGSLDRRLLFSMGCHSGLSVPDVYIAGADGTASRDWVETLGDQGAAGYVANTGYGYGDTAAVALSERLMASFAEHLDGSMGVGQALQFAKQEYASQLGIYGAYDEKVMAEATFYGLPMFRVRDTMTPPTPAAPAMQPAPDADLGGVSAAPFDLSEDEGDYELETVVAEDGTRFTQVAGELPQVTHGRPITPRFDLDVTAADAEARGVLLTGLTSTEGNPVDATFARPVIADSAREPARPADVAFPAYFASVNRHRTPSGSAAKLVLMPGQFVPDGDATTLGRGLQRRFTTMSGYVTYVDPNGPAAADVTPPTITATSAVSNAEDATFEATITDDSGVAFVLALYRDPSSATGAWLPVELTPDGGGTYTAAVDSGGADQIEYLVQAVDGAGNVGATTNKGYLYRAATDADPPEISVTSPVDGGRYVVGSSVTLAFACEDANLDSCEATLDGQPVADGDPLATTSPGQHLLVIRAEDTFGNVATRTVGFRVAYDEFTYAEPVASGQRTQVKAGSAVPVRFRIEDADGPVADRAAILSITSTKLTGCDGSAATDAELPATTDLAGLQYDPVTGEWKYVWKTDRSWKGQCRLLTVTLADHQTATATFTFK